MSMVWILISAAVVVAVVVAQPAVVVRVAVRFPQEHNNARGHQKPANEQRWLELPWAEQQGQQRANEWCTREDHRFSSSPEPAQG